MTINARNTVLTFLLFLSGSIVFPLFPEGKSRGESASCGNFLIINGESNVNRFSFSFETRSDDFVSGLNYLSSQNGTEIMIPVRKFEASNPHMYNDFLKQLHEHDYPYISVRFPDLDPGKPEDLAREGRYRVLITLAGVRKQYSIDCELINCGDHYAISGSEILRLTDFNISPPEKLNGLIKVKDEIKVSFGIILNFTNDKSYAYSR